MYITRTGYMYHAPVQMWTIYMWLGVLVGSIMVPNSLGKGTDLMVRYGITIHVCTIIRMYTSKKYWWISSHEGRLPVQFPTNFFGY